MIIVRYLKSFSRPMGESHIVKTDIGIEEKNFVRFIDLSNKVSRIAKEKKDTQILSHCFKAPGN